MPPRTPSRANLTALLILCRRAPRNPARPMFSSPLALVPIAIASHGALVTSGIAGLAERAAVGDDREVPGFPFLRWRPPLQRRSEGLVIRSTNEVPPPGDPSDVRVDRERRMAAGHGEDDIGRLRSHAGKGHQGFPRAVRRQRQNPFETVATAVQEGFRDPADSRCLLPRKTRMPDRLCDFLFPCVGESFRGDRTDS